MVVVENSHFPFKHSMDQTRQNHPGSVPPNSADAGNMRNDSEGFGTVPDRSEAFGTVRKDAESFRSVPKAVERKEMAGISTRVSVQTMAISFFRCSIGIDWTVSKMSDATKVLSFPPLKPTSQGRVSTKYNSRNESLISEMFPVAMQNDLHRKPQQILGNQKAPSGLRLAEFFQILSS